MEYEFRHNDKTIKLETANIDGKTRAILDNAIIDADIVAISENHFTLNIDGISHKVFVCVNDSNILVHINSETVELSNTDSERKTFSAGDHEFGEKDRVMSPMPGKVVKILASIGESVTAKQPLVIVESMKMENEIKSPSAGKIKEIKFAAGDLVGTGQPIILLEPEL